MLLLLVTRCKAEMRSRLSRLTAYPFGTVTAQGSNMVEEKCLRDASPKTEHSVGQPHGWACTWQSRVSDARDAALFALVIVAPSSAADSIDLALRA